MKAGIIVFPATNCEADTKRACEFFGWKTEYIWHSEEIKKDYDVIFLPGGFSYGDYVSAGRIAKFSNAVETLPVRQSLIVGICNGFQILCEKHLLGGALTCNENLKFLSKPCELEFNGKQITLPIAHHQGNYTFIKTPVVGASGAGGAGAGGAGAGGSDVGRSGAAELCDSKSCAEKLCSEAFLKYKNNENGSDYNIAGLYDKEKRVMGMMPHPERAVFKETGSACGLDGRRVFEFIQNECK